MSYQIYDVNGYVADLATNQGAWDLLKYLQSQKDEDIAEFGKELSIELTTGTIAKIKALPLPSDSSVAETLAELKENLSKCDEILIIGDGIGEGDVANISEFAQVDGVQGRRGRGKMEQATNAYLGALLDVYDSWAMATAKALLQANNPSAVLDTELPTLAEELKQAGRKGIREAVSMGLRGAEPGPEALSLMASEIMANETAIDEKLIPDIKQRLRLFINDNAGQPFDNIAIQGAMDSQRSKPAMGAGGFWVAIFKGGAISVAEEDAQRVAEGKNKTRGRWALDPNAEHCVARPGYYGCPDLAGEYDSWDAMPTVPAGQVACLGNCRCFIELETEHGWDRLA